MANLVDCYQISMSYGERTLFEDVSLTISEGEHVGLIGANGSGKSTLLAVLAGVVEPDQGSRSQLKNLSVAFVEQESHFDESQTVEQVLADALECADPEGQIDEAERYVKISQILDKLGFVDTRQEVNELSGGWRKRLAIASALVIEPDLLLLDEPTNHLDLEGILWLERLLSEERLTYILVSHDRAFLQGLTSRVVEIDRRYEGSLLSVDGRYSDFLEKREQLLALTEKRQTRLDNKVRHEIEWLRRGPKARTSKDKTRIRQAHELIDELGDLNTRMRTRTADIDFNASGRRTKKLLVAAGIKKSLGGRLLFSDLDLLLSPKMRLGVLGGNGSGKTTLLRVLSGEMEQDEGQIRHADHLQVVYFDQQREELDQNLSLKRSLAPKGDTVIYRGREIHVASWARRFLFRPDQLDTPLSQLSGGEQAKILIARLMLQPADVLILDEPTNDLDIPTLEILEDSLEGFPGAIVMVTHDRYLLDRVSTVMVGLDGHGGAEIIAEYAQWEKIVAERKKAELAARAPANGKPKEKRKVKATKLGYLEQREYDSLEEAILQAEEELAAARQVSEDPQIATEADRLAEAWEIFNAAQQKVDKLYARWSELEEKMEDLG